MINDENMRKVIKEIVEKIKRTYKPEKIILFGSYAYGQPTNDSDIDMLIIKKSDQRLIDRRIQVRHLVGLKEPVAFSPIVLTPSEIDYLCKIGDPFIKEILKKGKVLYG